VFDGDAPHQAGGAPAQAWSVAELLQLLAVELDDLAPPQRRQSWAERPGAAEARR
jgi:glycogen debranching enzyme